MMSAATTMAAAPGPSPDEGDMPTELPSSSGPVHVHVPPESDTPTASSEEIPSARLPPRPVPRPLPLETLDQTDASLEPIATTPSKRPLPSPRSARSFSLAHLSGPIKRKPLSSTASPYAVRFSKGPAAYANVLADLPKPEQRFARSCSVDSPTLYDFPGQRSELATTTSPLHTVSDWPASPDTSPPSSPAASNHPSRPVTPTAGAETEHSQDSIAGDNNNPAEAQTSPAPSDHESLSAGPASPSAQGSSTYELDDIYSLPGSPESQASRRTAVVANAESKTMSMFTRKSPPPQLNLEITARDAVSAAPATPLEQSANLNKPLPKSPASSKLSAFFGWATTPSPTATTEFSEKSYSPLPSPTSPKQPPTAVTESCETPVTIRKQPFANTGRPNSLQYRESYLQTPAGSAPTSLGQLEEMEDELKAISAELAASIRREMDLEDLVDRLQEQINNPQAPGRRTSDYFSDSGYSSAKLSDYDQAKEEISQIQRRAEQEKAQLRLELTNKLQDEREKRRLLDQQIQELSKKASQLDIAQIDTGDASGRVKELEAACEDLSRRLSEERQAKTNLEDLLGALKGELQSTSNERDNLRDEVVPQLRARLEGLEAEAADQARLAYDTSKLQQELQQLRSENAELQMLRSQNAELQMMRSQNAEPKPSMPTRMSMGLSRSASVTGGPLRKHNHSRLQSLSRSSSTKVSEPRDVLAERLKDVEAQRDALHSALKSLLERQELQNRENAKRIRQLEMERDRLLAASPKKAGYEREVSILRDEISVLRRRAEEAIEQKWQVEKGLAGLKMDLDRAESEIASLRSLLREKDILIPDVLPRPGSSHSDHSEPVSSRSLEQAYEDLKAAYMDALERIRNLEESVQTDEKTQLAIQRLEQSLSAAISDRDQARSEADSYREQVETLQSLEQQHLDTERDLASQLHESARRVEELAQQVRAQLETNATLRTRLADTIARGDAEQRVNKERIAGMQARLRTLEEQVVAAQTSAEERVARHEEEILALKDAHSAQLRRLQDASGARRRGSPGDGAGQRYFPPKSPLSPLFSLRSQQPDSKPSPRMSTPPALLDVDGNSTRSRQFSPAALRRASLEQAGKDSEDMTAQVQALRRRVAELEGALASADAEMHEVVGRMNAAQMEVLQLQEQREEAVRETRRLQKLLEAERLAAFEKRWKSLTTEVA